MNDTFRRRCESALMHPATLGALGVLLLNDIVFKALWPNAWLTGKLSDLAWMVFAPPLLAFLLSFLTGRNAAVHRAALLSAYVGLPLLYAAFNTFAPAHDAILRVIGLVGGNGPRSPLDPTDSLVIPFAMAAALWVWRRRLLAAESVRARLALLAAVVAALASVATSYDADYGIGQVGKTDSGTLGAVVSRTYLDAGGIYRGYESLDGGLTWTERPMTAPPETQAWRDWDDREVRNPSGAYYKVERPHVVRIREGSGDREVVYSFGHLRDGGNRWTQALEKQDVVNRVIATGPRDLFYDDRSDNLIVARGLEGVVVIAPDGTARRVAVGPYSPTDFSFGGKVRTYFGSLLQGETAASTAVALVLVFSFATLALLAPAASTGPRWCFALSAAISGLLAIAVGVFPYVSETPWQSPVARPVALYGSGFGLLPFLLAVGGMALARVSPRRVLAIMAATAGMLPLIAVGTLVAFEAGPPIANFVALILVGLASLGLWAYRRRNQGA